LYVSPALDTVDPAVCDFAWPVTLPETTGESTERDLIRSIAAMLPDAETVILFQYDCLK
jgi:hypothetical protein